MKRPAYTESQSRAIPFALENPYSILALDPGLGKSRCAIEIKKKLKLNCLVVCPVYLIDNWVKEINLWDDSPDITIFRKGKDLFDVCDTDYIIISYNLIQKAPYLVEWADMVVLDEAHAIKSMKAKRSEFLHRYIFENSVPRVHLLTGTPIKNRVQEFYSLLAVCFYDPLAAGTSFLEKYPTEIDFADRFSFRNEYTMQISGKWVTICKWVGLQNKKELKKWLKGRYLRIKSEDVLDLPPVTFKPFQISNSPDKELLRAFESYFYEDEDIPVVEREREERTSSVLPEHKAMAALKKVPFTIKYIEDLLEQIDCVVVYSDHVQSTKAIAAHFEVPAITGEMPAKKRSEMADDFQKGNGRVLVATIGSLKEGKDLYRANHMVISDFPWVPGDLKQIIHRIQRLGQKRNCTVHQIFGSPQDAYIANEIKEKMKVIDNAT